MSPSEADAIERDLLPLLRPDAGVLELSALREHVGRLRRAAPGAGLERLELTVVALDATNRFLAGNPFVEAVDAMEWRRVPSELAGFAVDLGLLARLWRIGHNDVPQTDERQVATGLGRVVAIAQRVAGVMGDLDWPRDLRQATHELGARWMGGGWTYLLEILERLPQTEPRNLAIYEALADEADPDLRAPVEHALAVFVETLGSPRLAASTALRAAIRRVVSGDEAGAFERGEEAFERMVAVGDPLGACCAAVLLGSVRRHDSGELARWFEHALGWARGHETAEVQLQLLHVLGTERGKAGDVIGQRRIFAEARKLVARDPEAWEELSTPWQEERDPARDDPDEPEHGARKAPARAELLPPELEQIGSDLAQGALMTAYETLGAYIGELLESHDDGAVVHMLIGHIARLKENDSVARGLLRAWLCAAVTELVADDDETWCAHKALQLDVEDRLGVTEELIMAGAWPDLLEDGLGVAWAGERPTLDPQGRAMQCIAEAEHAMQQGRARRARFWVERAQRYRARMDEA